MIAINLDRPAKYTFYDVHAHIMGYENKLQELKTALLEGVTLQTGITVVRTMNAVEDVGRPLPPMVIVRCLLMGNTAESMDLSDMPYAFGARYAQEKGCLPGTRESVIREICDILNNADEDGPQVCLLTGVAGSGKSAIAHSVARLYEGQQRLGTSYCFSSTNVARRNPQNLFATIARDIADLDRQFKLALCKIVKYTQGLRTSQSPFDQVEHLIIKSSAGLDAIGPLVIVVDALDESGNADDRQQLLDTLSRCIIERKLPTNLRFLIATRPENDILNAFPSLPQVVRKDLGDIPEAVVDTDIERFIHHSLHQYAELELLWPNQEWCQLLARHSQHLFLWGATACRFIQGIGGSGLGLRKRVEMVLQSDNRGSVGPPDELYQTILGELFPWDEARECFRNVMALLLALKEPLSLTSLSALFDSDEDQHVRNIIEVMALILDGALDNETPMRPVHMSFRDFLLDEARCLVFHVRITSRHSHSIGRALLACMRGMLRFNMCDLKDSRQRNAMVPNLAEQVNMAIPPHLSYACLHWMDHLQHAACTPELLHEVTQFFKDFFPYWLEAISLLSLSSPLSSILSAIETCTILMTWAKVWSRLIIHGQ